MSLLNIQFQEDKITQEQLTIKFLLSNTKNNHKMNMEITGILQEEKIDTEMKLIFKSITIRIIM